MITLRTYEKPTVSFVALQSSSPVAKCWNETNNENNNRTRYYDSEGHGFIKFNITLGQDCGNVTHINYNATYTCIYNEQNIPCEYMTAENEAKALEEFQNAWYKTLEAQANGGSNYAGIDDEYPPDYHGFS